MATKIAANETFEYWRVGNEVYRRAVSAFPPAFDAAGIPMDLRWECEYLHYCRFAVSGLYPLPALEVLDTVAEFGPDVASGSMTAEDALTRAFSI